MPSSGTYKRVVTLIALLRHFCAKKKTIMSGVGYSSSVRCRLRYGNEFKGFYLSQRMLLVNPLTVVTNITKAVAKNFIFNENTAHSALHLLSVDKQNHTKLEDKWTNTHSRTKYLSLMLKCFSIVLLIINML